MELFGISYNPFLNIEVKAGEAEMVMRRRAVTRRRKMARGGHCDGTFHEHFTQDFPSATSILPPSEPEPSSSSHLRIL
jgi:hypothetical protein